MPGLREQGWNVTLGLVEGRFHDVDLYLDAHPDEQILRIPYGTGTEEGRVRQLIRSIHKECPDIVLSVNIAAVAPAVNRIREKSGWSPHVVAALHAFQANQLSFTEMYGGVFDAVVCPNKLGCALVAHGRSVDPDRIYYVPCGVDINRKARRSKTKGSLLRLAYVGRLQRSDKRIADIVAIVDELDQRNVAYEMMIAGEGPDEGWLRRQLECAIKSGRVRFLGALSQSELVDQVYSGAQGVLITSPSETGPIVAWEAMANQVPVVTSAYIGSGLEDSLKPGQNCLTFPIGDHVGAVDRLLDLRDMRVRDRLIRGGIALVTARYSKAVSIQKWDSCLKKIASRRQQIFSSQSAEGDQAPPAGRLDNLLGRRLGETVRELLGLKYDHNFAGEEWPVAKPGAGLSKDAFWQLAKSLDVVRGEAREPYPNFPLGQNSLIR